MTVRPFKDGKYYMIDFRYDTPDGRLRHREVCPTPGKRAAHDFEVKRRREIEEEAATKREEVPRLKTEVPTFAEFAAKFMATYAKANNRHSEQTTKGYALRRHLLPVLGDLRLDAIGVLEIEEVKAAALAKNNKARSVNNLLTILLKILRYAADAEIIAKVPHVTRLKVPPIEIDFLDFGEAERILATCAQHEPEWYAMLHTALKTGLRFGELVELRWSDVDLVAGKVRVLRSYYRGHVNPPKGGKARDVPLSGEAVRVLKDHRHLRSELVFCLPDGARIPVLRARDAIRRTARRAGLRFIGWHTCRHSFASHLVMRGVSLKTIQELLGHASLVTTLMYAHLTPKVRRDAVALLDQPAKWATDKATEPENAAN